MTLECKHPGCDIPKAKSRGYCNAHYLRFIRGKEMDAPVRRPMSDRERFWTKVDKSASCWLWRGATHKGYGFFHYKGAARLAHRVSYLWQNGEIPNGLEVDHMCHNRACVNPSHLRLVTHSINGQNRASANSNSKSGKRGVYWCNWYQRWMARATLDRKVHFIGSFDSQKEAEHAAREWRREHMPYSVKDQIKKEILL